jgi:hypothetical protein
LLLLYRYFMMCLFHLIVLDTRLYKCFLNPIISTLGRSNWKCWNTIKHSSISMSLRTVFPAPEYIFGFRTQKKREKLPTTAPFTCKGARKSSLSSMSIAWQSYWRQNRTLSQTLSLLDWFLCSISHSKSYTPKLLSIYKQFPILSASSALEL